jgi:GntR family transcriptional regulator
MLWRGVMEQTEQLSDLVRRTLLLELTDGVYKNVNRLPPEREIAERLGVSRTVMRDALASLEQEGFISRKHGVGTIVNRHVLAVKTRMDLEEEFLTMIMKAGKVPKTAFCHTSIEKADAETAKNLRISPDDLIFQVVRLITANKDPAIYCIDRFACSLVNTRDYDIKVLKEPIFNFIKTYCNTEVYMDLTEVRAVAATEELATNLKVPVGSPLLHMNEIGYDFRGNPILSSLEYYKDQILHHTVLRKKI